MVPCARKSTAPIFFCFLFKNTDELFTYNFTFCFRLCYSGKFVIISLLCINTDEIQIKLSFRSEYSFYLIAFIFTKQTVIYEYTGQLFSDCSGEESCCNRRIYTTG